jgi:arylsulfatase A-like enzyme
MVGQILDALDASPYADNTAVVLWSDHGFHLGEKLHWHKMALWEHANRIPLLVRAPGRVEAGGGFDLPVSLLDLAPTLTDLAGIPQPAQFEGASLLGITPEIAATRPAEMRWGDAVSTRIGKWRWTRYADGGEELYDLSVDPREYNNLLGTTGRHEGGLAALT